MSNNKVNETVGRIKEAIGSLTGNNSLRREGGSERRTAEAREKLDDAKGQVSDVVDAAKETVGDVVDAAKDKISEAVDAGKRATDQSGAAPNTE